MSHASPLIEWKYLEILFQLDTLHPGNARACPKITKRHIKVDMSKMRVKLATQVNLMALRYDMISFPECSKIKPQNVVLRVKSRKFV